MNFSTKIKKLREEKKMKQQEVADKLGIARTTYASYEQGKREPDHETLIKIADYYDVTIDFLLRGESQETQDEIFNEQARKILEDPDTLVAAADGKITASILEAAQRIIADQLKSGRQPGDIKNGNKK
ncbi:helix-turn-helix transcriptional regulator [Bacillus subtilis]|nr:helix-turn-helix transcriptional regulator [Bacillus subtilis]MED3473851.1 helix-turn-helix transcriptional regulator [Bacillus subtilis]